MFTKGLFLVAVLALFTPFRIPPVAAADVFPQALLGPVVPAGRSAGKRPLPGLRPSLLRARAGAAPAYSIHIVGAPSVNSSPTGFNNTGQIFGQGDTGCFVYNGTYFTRLPIPSADPSYIDCQATSMNDATPGGNFEIGGITGNLYAGSPYAFAVTGGQPIVYYPYTFSSILGVNNNGISLASASFYPVRTTELSGRQLFTATGGAGYFAQLQPPASALTPIHYLLPAMVYNAPACSFGGCMINDRNEVLGYDYATLNAGTAKLAVSTIGAPASIVDLPISVSVSSGEGFVGCCQPVAFNNRDQIFYDDEETLGVSVPVPTVYDIAAGKKTAIPIVTPSCPKGANGEPLGMNNKGEALGSYYCTKGNIYSTGYFTWSAATGTQDLSLQIPNTNLTLYPVGVNDNGQILIGLVGAYFVTWGTLDPIVPAASEKATSRHSGQH